MNRILPLALLATLAASLAQAQDDTQGWIQITFNRLERGDGSSARRHDAEPLGHASLRVLAQLEDHPEIVDRGRPRIEAGYKPVFFVNPTSRRLDTFLISANLDF